MRTTSQYISAPLLRRRGQRPVIVHRPVNDKVNVRLIFNLPERYDQSAGHAIHSWFHRHQTQ